jgi:hypothetical protein
MSGKRTISGILFAATAALVLAHASGASAKGKRAGAEIGPLIFSGTIVPPAQARRVRSVADRCVPVTIKVGSVHKRHKRPLQRSAGSRPNRKPWVGYKTDFAGNSHIYYRVGSDSPFGPAKGLRGPY